METCVERGRTPFLDFLSNIMYGQYKHFSGICRFPHKLQLTTEKKCYTMYLEKANISSYFEENEYMC